MWPGEFNRKIQEAGLQVGGVLQACWTLCLARHIFPSPSSLLSPYSSDLSLQKSFVVLQNPTVLMPCMSRCQTIKLNASQDLPQYLDRGLENALSCICLSGRPLLQCQKDIFNESCHYLSVSLGCLLFLFGYEFFTLLKMLSLVVYA